MSKCERWFFVPFKLQLMSSSRDECAVILSEWVCMQVCVCVCPTEHAPVMFCFCQSDNRDGITSIYLESGITGHCLTVQADVLYSPHGRRWRREGWKLRDVCQTQALTVVWAGVYVAKGHLKKNLMLPGKGHWWTEYCDPREQLDTPRISCLMFLNLDTIYICVWGIFALSISLLILTDRPLFHHYDQKMINSSFFFFFGTDVVTLRSWLDKYFGDFVKIQNRCKSFFFFFFYLLWSAIY